MSAAEQGVRLRQAVLAAKDLPAVCAALESGLGVREPFNDPGVGLFGLVNAVFAIGDCFIEIVSPTQEDTAAGRHMARHGGDCGYMAIFDLEDLDGARARAQELGIRTVWQVDLPDISATHLHPADTRGAIVSLDQSRPRGTWRWGGPEWIGRKGTGAPGRLAGITLAVDDPLAVAELWARLLGVSAPDDEEPVLHLDEGAQVCFVASAERGGEGLVEIAVEAPRGQALEPLIEVGDAAVRVRERS